MLKFRILNGVKCALRNDILNFVQERGYPKQITPNDKVYNFASELFKCRRKIYYSWKDVRKDGDIEYPAIRNMDYGSLLHPYFGQLWTRAGFFLHEECHSASKEFKVSFRPDFVGQVRTKQTARLFGMKIGQIFVIDFKTISNRQYEFIKDGVPVIPKPEDEFQLQWYMGSIRDYLKIEVENIVPYGFLQYCSRDWTKSFWNGRFKQESFWDSDVALFQIPYNPRKYEKCKKFFKSVMLAVKKNKVPPREGKARNQFPCSYCDFSNHCWG